MIDINNPVYAHEYSPQAEWKAALISNLGNRFGLRTLVETGTCHGDTVQRVRQSFKEIWSIELCKEYFEIAHKRFEGDGNVHIVFGSSKEKLPDVIRQTQGALLFFLDAHVTNPTSANDGDPIPEELAAIKTWRPDSLVLIDDVKPDKTGYTGQDAHINIPEGWTAKFLYGVLAVHDGRYIIPERL